MSTFSVERKRARVLDEFGAMNMEGNGRRIRSSKQRVNDLKFFLRSGESRRDFQHIRGSKSFGRMSTRTLRLATHDIEVHEKTDEMTGFHSPSLTVCHRDVKGIYSVFLPYDVQHCGKAPVTKDLANLLMDPIVHGWRLSLRSNLRSNTGVMSSKPLGKESAAFFPIPTQ